MEMDMILSLLGATMIQRVVAKPLDQTEIFQCIIKDGSNIEPLKAPEKILPLEG